MAVSCSRVRRVLYGFSTAALFALVGCGGGNNGRSGPGLGPGPNNSMLHGQYAFSFTAQSTSNQGQTVFLSAVGTFTADGNGGISGGMEDANSGTGQHTYNFTGKYSVGSDLRGTAILTGLSACPEWQFTMVNSSHALMTCFDTANTGSGSIDIQDPTAFANAKLAGNYVFGLSGTGISQSAAAMAGDWTMDGLGNITRGEVDSNDGLSLVQDTALSGTYTVGANGRGSIQVNSNAYGTQNFVFYVVNATDLKILETDVFSSSSPLLSGEVFKQAAGPYSLATLKGGYAFTLGGIDSVGAPTGTGGVLTADGNGNVSGVLDDNDGGSVSLNVPFGSTSYGVGPNGRITMAFSAFQLVAYPAANGTLQIVEMDGSGVSSGMAKIQSGGPFTTASLSGNYALNWTGTLNPNTFSQSEEDITGQLTADGNGNLSGTLDVNSASNLLQGLGLTTSTYTLLGSNGYGSAGINTSAATFNMHYYQADPNTVLFLDVDQTRVLVGLMQK